MLFRTRRHELSEEEVVALLERILQSTGRLPRHADMFLATLGVQHIASGLRAAGVVIVRRPAAPLTSCRRPLPTQPAIVHAPVPACRVRG